MSVLHFSLIMVSLILLKLVDLKYYESWYNIFLLYIAIGHFRHHPEEYSTAVTELLRKAAITYSRRIQQLEGEKMGMEGGHDEISNPFNNLRKAAAMSRDSLHRVNLDLNDYFHVPSSVEYHEDRDVGSVPDESKGRYIPLSSPPKINAHGVLGQFLFDVCVPKNVEDWDLRFLPSMRSAAVASARRSSPFNPIKCILRSRLWCSGFDFFLQTSCPQTGPWKTAFLSVLDCVSGKKTKKWQVIIQFFLCCLLMALLPENTLGWNCKRHF